jgi:cell division protein FtsI (penicillin-binding protein 3)
VPSEPGSTIKAVTLMAGIEDGVITNNSTVEINGGLWYFGDRRIVDAERSPKNLLTYKEALEHSSNVAMAKLAALQYSKNPQAYLKHFTRLRLDKQSGIDLLDPYKPLIKNTKSQGWSSQTLASMGFGYELRVSPLQTLIVYNAIANGGKLMQPYLVSEIKQGNDLIKQIQPKVLVEKICKPNTLSQVKEALEAVCKSGTAKSVFDSVTYSVAGKTGTAQVSDGKFQYDDGVYQSSFVGYFPANNPRYSCIVVIKNKPKAVKYYGGAVAAPVFKEIADHLVVLTKGNYVFPNISMSQDTFYLRYKTATSNVDYLTKEFSLPLTPVNGLWSNVTQSKGNWNQSAETITSQFVPDVRAMGLRDALQCLENKGIKVNAKGKGKVILQSIAPGTKITKGMQIFIELK